MKQNSVSIIKLVLFIPLVLILAIVILSSKSFIKQPYFNSEVSATGALDTSFLGTNVSGFDNTVRDIVPLSDGRILVSGDFTRYSGVPRNRIARLNNDGSLDTSFNPVSGANDRISSIAVQSDGKVIIGGLFTTYDGVERNRIARVNVDGTLDTTFVVGTGANNEIASVSIQEDGKILVSGAFSSYNGTSRSKLMRLNTDGTLDDSFAVGTGPNITSPIVVAQSDGKVFIAGNFTSYNGTSRSRTARINSDGTVDDTYTPISIASQIYDVAIQNDGKYIVVGGFTGTGKNRIARINTDGTLDETFLVDAGFTGVTATDIVIQNSGKIVVSGSISSYNGTVFTGGVARLNTDGTLDETFSVGAGLSTSTSDMAVESDGDILLGGSFRMFNNYPRLRLARIGSEGVFDSTFNVSEGATDSINVIVPQSDGKVVIGGSFTAYNGIPVGRLARINTDGSLDTDFNTNIGTGVDNIIEAIVVQSDGKIIIGGRFTSFNEEAISYLIRLNADGTVDSTFKTNMGTGPAGYVYAITTTSSYIFIGGSFTSYNGTTRNRIARLSMDGSLSTGFNPDSGPNGTVRTIAVKSDGNVVIGGTFTTCRGVGRRNICFLLSNGTTDSAAVTDVGFSSNVFDIKIQSDGKIVVVGDLGGYDGTSTPGVARMSGIGVLDTTFAINIGTGADSGVTDVDIQDDGKIIVSGATSFTTFNDVSAPGIIRLNSNGTVDTSFSAGEGVNGSILDTAIQSDGKILIAGNFTTYNGIVRNYLARVYSSDSGGPTGSISINSGNGYTSSISVSLTLSATDPSGVSEMIICDNSDFTDCSWEEYSTSKSWMLTEGDGVKTVYVKFKDTYDNESEVYSDSIELETVPPTGSISINGDAEYTSSTDITLSLSGSDTSGISQVMMCNSSEYTDCTWVSYATTKSWTLTEGDGVKTVYAKFKDGAGNESVSYSDTIILDTLPPVGSTAINSDSTYTSSGSDITLSLLSEDATEMIICGDSSFTDCEYETFSSTKSWIFGGGDGVKVVYVKFKDIAGNESIVYSDSIILDTNGPTGTISINSGANISSLTNVTLTLNVTDLVSGISQVMVCNDSSYIGCSWIDYTSTKSWTLSGVDGTKTVYVRYRDNAGNISDSYSDSILLDTQGPTGSVTINSNAATTTSINVTLTLSAMDIHSSVSQMIVCSNSVLSGCTWEAYSTSKTWTLQTGNGIKTVYVQFKDMLNNISTLYSDTISLQIPSPTTPPVTEPETPTEETPQPTPEEKPTEQPPSTDNKYVTDVSIVGGKTVYSEVKVRVLDSKNNPVPHIPVSLNKKQEVTDLQGIATFRDVPAGKHTVTYKYKGKSEVKSLDLGEVDGTQIQQAEMEIMDLVSEEGTDYKIYFYILIGTTVILLTTLFIVLRKKDKDDTTS